MVCWPVILRWTDPIYFILIKILTGPLYEFFSVDVQGPIGAADTLSAINQIEAKIGKLVYCNPLELSP